MGHGQRFQLLACEMEHGSLQLHCVPPGQSIGQAYLMTIVVTILGTFLSLCVTTGFAYALSDPTLPGHRLLNFLCVFTMLFSGGIVASYYTWSQIFHIRNTLWALIVPRT